MALLVKAKAQYLACVPPWPFQVFAFSAFTFSAL
jgi:hypothetical protein